MQTEKEYILGREINALRCESVGEYSLPDYNGDVKKVLLVKTQVYPAGKFVGEDLLEFSGSVGYEVVYIDGENNVTHAEFSTDYEAAVRINSESYLDSDVKSTVLACNMRLIGPRKLSVKCSIDNDVRISEKRGYAVAGDAFSEHEPEFIGETAEVFTSAFASGELREINEEILSIDGAIADEVEVLASDVRADIEAIGKTGGGVELKGALKVEALYRNGESDVKSVEVEIPYAEVVELDSAYNFDTFDLRMDTSSKKVSVAPTEDGVSICLSMSITPKVYGVRNSTLELIGDAYLKECGVENEYSEFGYTEHICTERQEDVFDVTSSLGDGEVGEAVDVVCAYASAKVESCEPLDRAVKVMGEIRVSAIACATNDDGDVIYTPIKISLPFEKNVNLSCQIYDNMRVNADIDVTDVKMQITDNQASVSCNLLTTVSAFSDRRKKCLSASYTTDEMYPRDESVVTVYYPDASESLFEIAKKFHTSVSSIAVANRLTESVFATSSAPLNNTGIKKILIK